MWRNIVSVQEVVKVGCRRRIGDGESTRVWEFPWLPCPENGCLTTDMVPQLKDITVSRLMGMDKRSWEEVILKDMFNNQDVELIQRIPIPNQQRRDNWFWFMEDSGKFTVISVYKHLQGMHDTSYNNFWKKLWSLKIPAKVINFLWCVCRGCLPTMTALALKHINVDKKCPWCFCE